MLTSDTKATQARSPDVVVATPFIEAATAFMLDCCSVGGWGLISGSNGSGKTVAMRRLAARYSQHGRAGVAFYYCCRPVEGTTRAVKDLLAEMEIGGAFIQQGQGAPLQLLFKVALREFKRRDVRLLLLDESERCDAAAVDGLVALYDYMREKGHPLVIILASAAEQPEWLNSLPSARSRTLAAVKTEDLSLSLMLGIVREWADEFATLTDGYDNGAKEAITAVETIYARVGNNFRRLNYFVCLYIRHFAGLEVTPPRVKEIFSRMTEGN